MKPGVSIQIYKNIDELSDSAKQAFFETANKAIQQQGRFLSSLSGGSTPLKLYEKLVQGEIDWSRVHFFWGDERCVPVDDNENNYGQAKKVLFDKIKIPSENIHRILSELKPDSAARDYGRTLKIFSDPPLAWPRFDLVLLGLGSDGHTASLFPGPPVDIDSPTLAVTANYQGRPANRVTLTQPVFNSAKNIFFLVSGENKAQILQKVISDDNTPIELPAQRIKPDNGKVIWFVDKEAASLL